MRINTFYLLTCVFTLCFSCSEKEDRLPHRNIVGTFKLETFTSSFRLTDEHGVRDTGEDLMTACDLETRIELKSDGELILRTYSGEDCEVLKTRMGNWKVTQIFFGSFIGEIIFEDSPVQYDIFESEENNEQIIEFRIEYEDENPPENIKNLRYHYTYRRVN